MVKFGFALTILAAINNQGLSLDFPPPTPPAPPSLLPEPEHYITASAAAPRAAIPKSKSVLDVLDLHQQKSVGEPNEHTSQADAWFTAAISGTEEIIDSLSKG